MEKPELADAWNAWFPVEWNFGVDPGDGIGGLAVDDGAMLYVEPEDSEDEGPYFRINLRTVVEDMIWAATSGNGNIYSEGRRPLMRVRNSLSELVQLIDDELARRIVA